jgi:hypothetical protein
MKYVEGQDKIILNMMREKSRLIDNTVRVVEATCIDITNHAKTNHERNSAHGMGRYEEKTGLLTKSIHSKITEVTERRTVGTIFAGTDYAFYVEFGTKINRLTGKPNRPYPFFQPALLANKRVFLDRLKRVRKRA